MVVYETDGTMNAFINQYKPKNDQRFEGTITFNVGEETVRVFIKPNVKTFGYIIRASKKDYDSFNALVNEKLQSKTLFVERPFHETFFGEPEVPPVLPKGAEEPPDLSLPFTPGASAVTVDELLQYTKVPLTIALKDKRIFMRYQQPGNTSDMLYERINSDDFLREFAVPQMCYHSTFVKQSDVLLGGATLPTGISWPCTPEMFDPLTPEMKLFLKSRPYRLLNISVKRDGENYVVIPYRVPLPTATSSNYNLNTVYCQEENGLPMHMSVEIISFIIESSLRTNVLLPEEERMILIDLYLHRDRDYRNEYSFLWHCDGSRKFECSKNDTVPFSGHENVDYLSLLMIMDKNTVAKSTSMISNVKSERDASAQFSAEGPCKSVFTVSVTSGTTLCISDMDYFHSTPCSGIPKKVRHDIQDMVGYPENVKEKISMAPSLLSMSLSQDAKDMLQRDTTRCFIRCHFVSSPKIPYEQMSDPIVVPIPYPVDLTRGKVVPLTDISQLNGALLHPFNTPFEGAPYGFKLGGKRKTRTKKYKNRKTRRN